jgi:hypothetical protein
VSGHWRRRESVTLSNGLVQATLLTHGGYLSTFGFAPTADHPNLLWEAPYATADCDADNFAALASTYGGGAVGRFLASFTGHALCLDQFGMPSAEEEAQGVGLHGEAALARWQVAATPANGLTAQASLPIAGLEVTRNITMLPGEAVMRVAESVRTVGPRERAVHWVQHATWGAPFHVAGESAIDAPLGRAAVWPLGYEGAECLKSDAEFAWPLAPASDGKQEIDLRMPFHSAGCGFVAACLQQAGRLTYVVGVNWRLGVAMGYCFRRADFPWLTLWEENCARKTPPWNGRVQARGIEFGTTPFPLGRQECAARGAMFGERTDRVIAAGSTAQAPWLQFVARVPTRWRGISEITVERDALLLQSDGGEQVSVPARGAQDFFNGEDQ